MPLDLQRKSCQWSLMVEWKSCSKTPRPFQFQPREKTPGRRAVRIIKGTPYGRRLVSICRQTQSHPTSFSSQRIRERGNPTHDYTLRRE